MTKEKSKGVIRSNNNDYSANMPIKHPNLFKPS